MKQRIALHIGYWALILLFQTLFFGHAWGSRILAFYFSSMLLPVVIGSSYFFNLFLVPRYLLTGKYRLFVLYFIYLLVVSLYLEMLVSMLSFIVLANYQAEAVRLEGISIFILGVNLYLIVFATGFIRLVIQFRKNTQLVGALKSEIQKQKKATVLIRADRKTHHIPLDELLYIESLDDYVRVVTTTSELTAREKISNLHGRLPAQFIRIHRSFVVNTAHVQSFSKGEVMIREMSLPIGRTYKDSVMAALEGNA